MLELDFFAYKYTYMLLYALPILFIYIENVSSRGNSYLLTKQSYFPIFAVVVFLIFFLGFRATNTFQDTVGYKITYEFIALRDVQFDWESEWLWSWIMVACKKMGLSVSQWLAIIELGYLGLMFWTCKKLLYENVNLAVLFFLSSSTFFAYGVNTIRNGFACSIVLFALSFFADTKKKWSIGFALLLLAFGIHRSVSITSIAIFASLFVVKRVKYAVYIWLVCILLSLSLGDLLSGFFAGIDFDERFNRYANHKGYEGEFSRTGFRWDFLLYSSVPIVVAWIATEIKGVKDSVFSFISSVYILANAIWVLCIRISFSDRFAYLSWFMYPLVMAYAFIRLPMYKNQDSVTAWVLLCYAGFTLFMGLFMAK